MLQSAASAAFPILSYNIKITLRHKGRRAVVPPFFAADAVVPMSLTHSFCRLKTFNAGQPSSPTAPDTESGWEMLFKSYLRYIFFRPPYSQGRPLYESLYTYSSLSPHLTYFLILVKFEAFVKLKFSWA